MAFEAPDKEKAIELASQIDELIVDKNLSDLSEAIKMMSQNTRESLERALEMAKQ